MKNLLFIAMMLSFFQNSYFYKKLFSDVSENSYYIYLVIEYDGKDKEVIVENQDLYEYIRKTENLDEKKYVKRLSNLLKSHKKLTIKKTTSISNFLDVIDDKEVEKVAQKGQEYFLTYYFNKYGGLKPGIYENTKRIIIKKLFTWGILCRINDEAGILVYHKFK